jgi:riboflavin synthase
VVAHVGDTHTAARLRQAVGRSCKSANETVFGVTALVLAAEATVSANDGCSRSLNLGWDGVCDDCFS